MNDDSHLNSHFIYSVYKMLGLMGIDPALLQANIKTEDTDGNGKTAFMMLGIPTTKVGLSLEQDNAEPLEEDGWYVSPVRLNALQQFHDAFQAIHAFALEHRRRSTMNATKQTSQHEQWLIDALITRGLPIPDRNYRLDKEDGKELTTPDMAWEDMKIAFFVDGLWWHQSRDDSNIIKGFLEEEGNDKYVMEHNKTRAEKDASIRSEMQLRGWKVLSCTDRDLESHVGIQKQVDNIERMMDSVRREQAILAQAAQAAAPADNNDSGPDIMDLL